LWNDGNPGISRLLQFPVHFDDEEQPQHKYRGNKDGISHNEVHSFRPLRQPQNEAKPGTKMAWIIISTRRLTRS
jgi:hypothetical protein